MSDPIDPSLDPKQNPEIQAFAEIEDAVRDWIAPNLSLATLRKRLDDHEQRILALDERIDSVIRTLNARTEGLA